MEFVEQVLRAEEWGGEGFVGGVYQGGGFFGVATAGELGFGLDGARGVVEVGVGGCLEAEEFALEGGEVDVEGAGGGWAEGEGFGEEGVEGRGFGVFLRDGLGGGLLVVG